MTEKYFPSDRDVLYMCLLTMNFFEKHKSCDNEIIKVCIAVIATCCQRQENPETAFSNLNLCFEKFKKVFPI